jgi:hypothetical protein
MNDLAELTIWGWLFLLLSPFIVAYILCMDNFEEDDK